MDSEVLTSHYQRIWLIKKYRAKVNLHDLVSCQWEQLLNELLSHEFWDDFETSPLPTYFESYWNLSYPDRVVTIKFLINCLFDCTILEDAM